MVEYSKYVEHSNIKEYETDKKMWNIITPIIDLLTKRYEAQLFTIVTTNLDPKDIRKRYGDRIADRLNEMMEKIVYRNPTYRVDEIQTDGMS